MNALHVLRSHPHSPVGVRESEESLIDVACLASVEHPDKLSLTGTARREFHEAGVQRNQFDVHGWNITRWRSLERF